MATRKRTTEGPRQTVNRLPDDTEVGPNFPSGMSAPEAAGAGATDGMSEMDIAVATGEKTAEEAAQEIAAKRESAFTETPSRERTRETTTPPSSKD